MIKKRALNPIYIFVCLFLPWRFINTFYTLDENKFTISRYYAEKSGDFKKRIDTIDLSQLDRYGFPNDVGTGPIEGRIKGTAEQGGGQYIPEEVHFVMKNNKAISWNVRPYTKKQCREVAKYIDDKFGIKPGMLYGRIIGYKK